PDGNVIALKAQARGVQIYTCRARADEPKQSEWVLRAPEAELFDEHGRRLGTHFAGPTWKANDGSQIVGEVRERAPSPAPGAVPWLLLAAKKSEGKGVLADDRWIQRVETRGGVAPAGSCESGKEARVAYQATYYFWTGTGSAPPAH